MTAGDSKAATTIIATPRSSHLRDRGQLRRAEHYRQTTPLKRFKIGSR